MSQPPLLLVHTHRYDIGITQCMEHGGWWHTWRSRYMRQTQHARPRTMRTMKMLINIRFTCIQIVAASFQLLVHILNKWMSACMPVHPYSIRAFISLLAPDSPWTTKKCIRLCGVTCWATAVPLWCGADTEKMSENTCPKWQWKYVRASTEWTQKKINRF